MIWDLIALGETMLAFAPPAAQSWRDADRVLVDHAGAESNTCVGLARLGFRVAWVSRLGDDPPGDRILHALAGEGVATDWIRRDRDRPTGLMLKEYGAGVRYYRAGSAATALSTADLAEVPVETARAVLVTGVTALISASAQTAGLALLSRATGLRIVDPNLRRGLWGSARRVELVRPLVERGNLLLGGSEELREICGGTADAREAPAAIDEQVARAAAACGPVEVVVRGAHTVGALRDGIWRALPIERGLAVDPIGAGDAFNAGYIAMRLRGEGIEAALRAGVRCGAAVTTAPSDTLAFPRTLA